MPQTSIELDQELTEINSRTNNTYNAVRDVSREGFKNSREFFYKLSLTSGGIISLSITFIGYLLAVEEFFIKYAEVLLLGWVFLLLCLFSSMYRNHFHGAMLHWQVSRKFADCKKDEQQWILKALKYAPNMFANLPNATDVIDYKTLTSKQLASIQKDLKTLTRNERISNFLWVLTQNMAHITFIVGVTLVVVFAAINLPVEFRLFRDIKYHLNNYKETLWQKPYSENTYSQ